MVALIFLFLNLVASLFRSKSRLEAENAVLRQQLIVLQRKVRGRVQFTNGDRLFFIQLYRWFPSVLKAIKIIRPETLVRWHRAGFCRYWRWKSRNLGGRPQISTDLRPASQVPRFPTPVAAKTGTMPAHQGLRPNDLDGLEDRGKPPIQLDEEEAITVCELHATANLALQHD